MSAMQPRFVVSERIVAIIVLSCGLFLLMPFDQRVATADPVDDLLLEAAVKAAFSLDPYLWSLPVTVRVSDGCVTVSGKVDHPTQKSLVMRKIRDVVDSAAIVDELKFCSAGRPDTLQSGARLHVMADIRTAIVVRKKIGKGSNVAVHDLRVRVTNGAVMLDGEVETSADKMEIGRLASKVKGVVRVTNNLRVHGERSADEPAARTEPSWKGKLHDALIAAQARRTLAGNDELASSSINLDVRNGVVTLSGEVPDEDKLFLAGQLVGKLRGVADVKNELQLKQ